VLYQERQDGSEVPRPLASLTRDVTAYHELVGDTLHADFTSTQSVFRTERCDKPWILNAIFRNMSLKQMSILSYPRCTTGVVIECSAHLSRVYGSTAPLKLQMMRENV